MSKVSLPLRTAQKVQLSIKNPFLFRAFKIPSTVSDRDIIGGWTATSRAHPLMSMRFDKKAMTQQTIGSVPKIDWLSPSDDTLLPISVIPVQKMYSDWQQENETIHTLRLLVKRTTDGTYLYTGGPHTIFDGYGISNVAQTFINSTFGIVSKSESAEIKAYEAFVRNERREQEAPSQQASSFWRNCCSSHQPLELARLEDRSSHAIQFSIPFGEEQVKNLTNKYLQYRASITTGLIATFTAAFSAALNIDSISIRMTDNQRRDPNRQGIGGYFAEDYAIFLSNLGRSSFADLLNQAAEKQRLGIKFIGSFRSFDRADLKTTDIKFHNIRDWKPQIPHQVEQLSFLSKTTFIDRPLRLNYRQKGKGAVWELVFNNDCFTHEMCRSIVDDIEKKLNIVSMS